VNAAFRSQLVKNISTDSRTLCRGDVYIALRGDRFDGHRFISQAVERGASAIVSEVVATSAVPVLLVKDSLRALATIARGVRELFKGPAMAVTGSAGKSSTKEMITRLLGENAVCSPASFNNLIGVSKTVFLLDEKTQYLVLEMGMNARFEIKELCEYFRPEFGLITNIGNAHVGKLGGQEEIYLAKKELFDHLLSHGTGIAVNVDDPLVVRALAGSDSGRLRSVRYSASGRDADVVVDTMAVDPKTAHLALQMKLGRGAPFHVDLPLFGLHHGENLAGAMAVQLLMKRPESEWMDRLKDIRPAPHRGEIFSLSSYGGKKRQNQKQLILIDESYNSNPAALESSLKSFAKLEPHLTKLLILGDMLEMGEFSPKVHTDMGQFIKRLFSDHANTLKVLGVGTEIQHLLKTLKSTFRTYEARSVLEAWDITEKSSLLDSSEVVLVKGSRGVGLEKWVEKAVAPAS